MTLYAVVMETGGSHTQDMTFSQAREQVRHVEAISYEQGLILAQALADKFYDRIRGDLGRPKFNRATKSFDFMTNNGTSLRFRLVER